MNNEALLRFLSRVYPEPNTGCWLWGGAFDKDGYGNFSLNRKPVRAHRLSYQIFKGDTGNNLVLHTCDVACCVNPDHLFLGTHQDNIDDKVRKNRCAKGERSGNAKLNETQVREIRLSNDSLRKLGKKYNVDKALIMHVKKRNIWKHI